MLPLLQVLMRFDSRFHRSFIAGMRYNVRFSIKRTSFVFMHEAVEVARSGAAAAGSAWSLASLAQWALMGDHSLRKELLMPPANARRVAGQPVEVSATAAKRALLSRGVEVVMT